MKTYLVGGAVRDLLMGNSIQDRDYVVVGSSHDEMLAQGYSQVGAAFPVYLHPSTGEEYALARTETKTGSGHTGFSVRFDDRVTLADDLGRRDLTINSIALDEEAGQYFDPYGGVDDLNSMVLRHTTQAFKDDPLRVIRLCRFAARFIGFTIAPETWALAAGMVQHGELAHLSDERFAVEIEKVLMTCTPAGCAKFFTLLHKLEVQQHVPFFRYCDMPRLAGLALAVRGVVGAGDRVEVFSGLSRADPHFAMMVGGSEGKFLMHIAEHCRSVPAGVDLVGALMSLYRQVGWQEVKDVKLVCQMLSVGEGVGDGFVLVPELIMKGFLLAAPLSAAGARMMADGMSGREIGDAIAATRRAALSTIV